MNNNRPASTIHSLRCDLLAPLLLNSNITIPRDEISIFIDPLDGTREFVEGRWSNVGCLVGIARNGRVIAGVVGRPFPPPSENDDDDGGGPVVVVEWALLGNNVKNHVRGTYYYSKDGNVTKLPTTQRESSSSSSSDDCRLEILTGDSKDFILHHVASTLLPRISPSHKRILIGGTAAKLLHVSQNPHSIAVLHFKTELWDTCATEALITASGGKMTDLFGSPLEHVAGRVGNVWGVVASGAMARGVHERVCEEMRGDKGALERLCPGLIVGEEARQAIDVARDLDGRPLTTDWLTSVLSPEQPCELIGFNVPEQSAVRGMMSDGCRLHLTWSSPSHTTPRTAFFKRIVMSRLHHARNKLQTAPHKLIRDVKSYQVETAFLTSKTKDALAKDTNVHINKVYAADLRPARGETPEELLESRFALLLEDFSGDDGWRQEWLLSSSSSLRALKSLAAIHAYFWESSNFWSIDDGRLGQELESKVWSNGGYMQPSLQGWDQVRKINEGYRNRYPEFEESLKRYRSDVDWSIVGERLERVATMVGVLSHPFYEGSVEIDEEDCQRLRRYRTFIHGDPKQANIFFNDNKLDKGDDVGWIDFQWSGFGLAATDVAHHISAAVRPQALSYDGTTETSTLLDGYYEALVEGLVKFGVAKDDNHARTEVYPRDIFQNQYELALLDVCRLVFAYAWRRYKDEGEVEEDGSFNRNAYNKKKESALWLIVRCNDLLDKWESKLVRSDAR